MGRVDVYSQGGFRYQCENIDEAKYLIYSQRQGTYVARVPIDRKLLVTLVDKYEQYLRFLKNQVYSSFMQHLLNHSQATNLTKRFWEPESF